MGRSRCALDSDIRSGEQNSERKVYRPIESFGTLYMQADNWHTNADGYEMIAKALVEVLKKEPSVNDYLRSINGRQQTSSSDSKNDGARF